MGRVYDIRGSEGSEGSEVRLNLLNPNFLNPLNSEPLNPLNSA
jgi:hypothetical protein